MDITSAENSIANTVNQYIVKPTGSASSTNQGINGYLFDIIGDENFMLESDITDHFVEDNSAIQDHIALRPPKFTLKGYVGELSDYFGQSFLNLLTNVQSLSSIAPFMNTFASQATQTYNKIQGAVSQVGQIVNQVQNLSQLVTGASTSSNKQQAAYIKFFTWWQSRTLCTVETPWNIYNNMAIERVDILQREDNKLISEFSVTFKQIRFINTQYTSNSSFGGGATQGSGAGGGFDNTAANTTTGRVSSMTSPTVNLGQVAGSTVTNGVGSVFGVPGASSLYNIWGPK